MRRSGSGHRARAARPAPRGCAPVAVLATLAGLRVALPDPLWDLGAVLFVCALLRLAFADCAGGPQAQTAGRPPG